jgi:hypothetical protein
MLATMRQHNSVEPLEAVVSIPRDSSPSDESVLAVSLFSRQQLKDDSQGSLRSKVEEQLGKRETRQWLGRARNFVGRRKKLDVFAILGLADAPSLSESSTRILLSKIEKYAHTQQRLVVVPECKSSDGTDLTDYFVRLGFEKVEMTDRPSLLVYTGASRSTMDMFLENDQVMIGILVE